MPALPWTTRTAPDPDTTYVVMGSRLPLQGFRFVPRFMAHTMKIRRQLASAEGLIGYALNARLTQKEFWTVSVWRSRDDLERFAEADPHARIIRTKRERMAPTTFVFWTCAGRDVPVAWDVVTTRLRASVSDAT